MGGQLSLPSADTRTIYVSSSTGNDANNGLSPNSAVATIAEGLSLIRDGSADHLLLKAGDTWVNQSFGWLNFSGRSGTEPILISSYGSGARPLIETPANSDVAIGALTTAVLAVTLRSSASTSMTIPATQAIRTMPAKAPVTRTECFF